MNKNLGMSNTEKVQSTTIENKDLANLRRKAESSLLEKAENMEGLTPDDFKNLVHEFRTYQIELEMQNDELRLMQSDLEISRRKYSDLYDFAPVGYFTFNRIGLILDLNLVGADMLGESRSSLIRKPFLFFLNQKDRIIFHNHSADVLLSKSLISCELKLIRKDRQEFFVELQSIYVEDDRGSNTVFRSIILDISKRRKAENLLREAEYQYQTLFISMNEGCYLAELIYDILGLPVDYKYIEVNPAYERLIGLKREHIIGKRAGEIVPDLKPDWFETFRLVALIGKPIQFHHHSENTNRYFEIVVFKPSKGHIAALVTDITGRKEEENLLLSAKAKAEEATQLKNKFLANVSHELRTPLNTILGYLQLFNKAGNMTQQQIENLEVLQNTGGHLLRIINELLDLTKIESGMMQIEKYQFNFPVFLKNIAQNISVQTAQNAIDFKLFAISELPVYLKGDKIKLEQILLNLLSNAIKFTPKGHIYLKIALLPDETAKLLPLHVKIRFEIEDTGIGIHEKDYECIFNTFHQLNNNQGKSKGTGLGLSISRQLARMMGCELYVKSEIGKGSTFWFDLILEQYNETYDDSVQFSRVGIPYPQPEKEFITPPPQEEMRKLLYLVKIGDIINIRKYIDLNKRLYPDLVPFITKLSGYAKNIDFAGLFDFLKSYHKE